DWHLFGVLEGRDDVRARIHVLPKAALPTALTQGSVELIKRAVSHPANFGRYVAHTWRTRNETKHGFARSLYLRQIFVGHALDILHIEFDAQGIGIADLKDYLGCHVLLSARGTFQQLSVLDTHPDACAYLFRYADGYHFISRFLDENTHQLGLPPEVPTWLIE